MEKRATNQRVELRADGEAQKIVGYAAVFYREGDPGTQYPLWAGAVERVMPGAFDEALRTDDVRALFNHDANLILGRTAAGTLSLSVDSVGLRYEIVPDVEDPDHQRLLRKLARGDVSGSSFGFEIRGRDGAAWTEEERDGVSIEVRELRSLRLYDVGPVVFPAYQSSTAEARSDHDRWSAEIEAKRQRAEQQQRQRESYLRRAYLFLRGPLTPGALSE